MTTLAVDTPRVYHLGDVNEIPVIATDIIYEGSAVGIVDASGHARPLAAADTFAGFAQVKADNSAGAAADIRVSVRERGKVKLSVTGALITDVGQAVWATDDNAFGFSPVSGVFCGYVHQFVSAGVVILRYDASWPDPFAEFSVREQLTGTKTFDAQDTGKLFSVTAAGDGDALTLPSIADGYAGGLIYAEGAFGTTALTISPAAADMILGPDITGADDKDLICTKATQVRGDFVQLGIGDADGYVVTRMRGTWAREA